MNNVFLALMLISLIAMVIGLFSPSIVIRWGKHKTRLMALIVYGGMTMVFFILFGAASPQIEHPVTKTVPVVTTAPTPSAQNSTVQKDSTPPAQDSATQTTPSPSAPTQSTPTLATTTYPFQSPTDFEPYTPEFVLASYMSAWRDQDWAKMAGFTQLTWQQGEQSPAVTLENMFSITNLKGFKILQSINTSDVIMDINFEVQTTIGDVTEIKQGKARLIKESAPYKSDKAGTWGVNPISAIIH